MCSQSQKWIDRILIKCYKREISFQKQKIVMRGTSVFYVSVINNMQLLILYFCLFFKTFSSFEVCFSDFKWANFKTVLSNHLLSRACSFDFISVLMTKNLPRRIWPLTRLHGRKGFLNDEPNHFHKRGPPLVHAVCSSRSYQRRLILTGQTNGSPVRGPQTVLLSGPCSQNVYRYPLHIPYWYMRMYRAAL